MDGTTIRHEPDSMDALHNCPEAYHIFRDAGWVEFFQNIKGSNEVAIIEFDQNLNNNQTRVRGIQVVVTE